MRLSTFNGNSALSTLVSADSASEHQQVAGRPLDVLVDPDLRPRIKLIKIDVEGLEMEVLEGATQIFAELPDTAQLVVEVSVNAEGRSAAVEWLRARGFKTFLFRNRYAPLEEQMLQSSARAPEPCDALPAGTADVLFVRL
jgi:hypothetical protein